MIDMGKSKAVRNMDDTVWRVAMAQASFRGMALAQWLTEAILDKAGRDRLSEAESYRRSQLIAEKERYIKERIR